MPAPSRYYTAYDKPPFCFAVTGARALPGPVLVDLMGTLDLTPSANRSVLNRMVGAGSLGLERVGRVGVYRLAGRLLDDFTRIERGGTAEPWAGRFHVLVDGQPERGRVDVERYRVAAVRLGYRPLRPGVLVAPRDLSAPLSDVLRQLGVHGGEWEVDDPHDVARRAWGLDTLAREGQRIADALDQTTAVEHGTDDAPTLGQDSFRRLHRISRPVVRWLVAVGDLPAGLMPDDWPGQRLCTLLADAHARHLPEARGFARAVADASRHAALVEY